MLQGDNKEILNLEGHPICITGSKVMDISLNGWILPIVGAPAVKGLCLQPPQHIYIFFFVSNMFLFFL